MLKFMLDTNIVIYVIKRKPLEVLETFNRYAGQMCISSITLAELFHGVEKSEMPERNLKEWKTLFLDWMCCNTMTKRQLTMAQ